MPKQIKKVLFIIPPYFDIKNYISKQLKTKAPIFTLPSGVISIATFIEAYSIHDVRVEILDLNRETYKLCNIAGDIEEKIKGLIRKRMFRFDPDIIGISSLFNVCYNYLELISVTCKNVKKNSLIVMGGGVATNLYNEVLSEFSNIDALCFAEGEIPMKQLLDVPDVAEAFISCPAWITRNSLKSGRLPQSVFVNDLDEIPPFDYKLMDINEYRGRKADQISGPKEVRQLSIHTSRGCPFDCVFCASSTVHGKKVRFMSIERVVNEVKQMVDLYKIEVLAIEDDNFLADKERAKEILRRLSNLNLRIEFPNGTAIYAIDEEIGKLLKKAGVTTVSLAMESGSDFVLKKIINKPLKLDMVKNAVNILRKNGICVHCAIVLGLPGELEEHREETMRMILTTGFDWVYFNLAVPVVGSRLYKICKDNHYLINDDFDEHNTSKCNIRTPDIDPEYMEEKAYLMNLEANFVKNYNLTIGEYEKASLYFQNVALTYHNHDFAQYFLAKAYECLGKDENIIKQYRDRFQDLVNTNNVWAKYAKIFKLDAC